MPEPAGPAPDLDLRLVRYFTAVAEHRHFGRAAETLRIAQPSLSRQIRSLERRLGARLLDRTPRGTRLTEAGEVFLPLAKALLRSAAQAASRTRAAARPDRVTVGVLPPLIVTSAVRELRRRHPEAEVATVHLRWDDVSTALLDHRADAVVARLPFPTERLRVTLLYSEPRVLVVPRDHRLAGRKSATLDDIADEPLPRVRDSDPVWDAYWRIDPRPDGRPAPGGPLIESMEDKLEHVAAGEAVAIMATGATAGLRPDLTVVPLDGVEPSHVVLATRAGDRSGLVTAFAACAGELLTEPGAGAEGESGPARGVARAPAPGGEPGFATGADAAPGRGVVPAPGPGGEPGSVRGAPVPVRGVEPGCA